VGVVTNGWTEAGRKTNGLLPLAGASSKWLGGPGIRA
jgi:hypothetical protein